MIPVSPVAPTAPSDLESLKKLPGYGSGFLCSGDISEAVAVLGPYLKILGPHLGRDPVMFAKVRISTRSALVSMRLLLWIGRRRTH